MFIYIVVFQCLEMSFHNSCKLMFCSDSVLAFKMKNKLGRFNPELVAKMESDKEEQAHLERDLVLKMKIGQRCEVRMPHQPSKRGAIMYIGRNLNYVLFLFHWESTFPLCLINVLRVKFRWDVVQARVLGWSEIRRTAWQEWWKVTADLINFCCRILKNVIDIYPIKFLFKYYSSSFHS